MAARKERDNNELLARLASLTKGDKEDDYISSLEAKTPEAQDVAPSEVGDEEDKLDAVFERINRLAAGEEVEQTSDAETEHTIEDTNRFIPEEPESFREAGLSESEVESLILKRLLNIGCAAGREVADHVRLPFVLIDQLLRQLKVDQLVAHKGAAPMNDYQYILSDLGRERARRLVEQCAYADVAPVVLRDYIHGVKQQSLTHQHPTEDDLRKAFGELQLNPKMLDRLGPAVNSGRGLFLFGYPGNGKTSIAERVTTAFGSYVWIPRSIVVDGEIIRLFDPVNHEEVPVPPSDGIWADHKVDRRWIRVRRPTIIAGGELTMEALEVSLNRATGVCEAPLQLKSNCGTLVIDDFGRQRMPVDELLNRWIVPLEKRYDFLNLPNGKKVQVPFDQLIVFSTNLEPRDLVDEAFLRRIPYKIEVIDPTEDEFRELMQKMADKLDLEYDEDAVEYLIETHYRQANRNFRFCHPRDLLMQVVHYCTYHNSLRRLTRDYFDMAVENYFAVM